VKVSRGAKVAVLILLGVVLVAILLNVDALAIFQEGNPFPVLWAILQLELSESKVVPFGGDRLIQKDGPEIPLTYYMAQRGWSFQDRLGAGIVYSKRGEDLTVIARCFSRHYVVYDIGRPLESLGSPGQ